jgi:Predicted amidophosphoribosyltransferases
MEKFIIASEEQWYKIPEERESNFRNLIGERRRGRVMNTGFFVNESDEIRLVGKFVKQDTNAFYHADYKGGGSWQIANSIENLIWTLKNDVDPFPDRIQNAIIQFSKILHQDLPQILQITKKSNLTVCVIPRSKAESHYRKDQLFFREVISLVVDKLPNFDNGTKYIIRHTNTRTTHLDRNGEGGDGNLPYPGITKDTCTISENVKNKDILLIDDLYTKTVNIDEDAIQALLDKGAKSVVFYSIGKTVSRIV